MPTAPDGVVVSEEARVTSSMPVSALTLVRQVGAVVSNWTASGSCLAVGS